MPETVYRTCNVCEAMCGLALTVDDGRITDVRGDKDDVFSRGHLCPKGPAMREVLEDPDRLRHPLKRTATGWERISWEQAFDETARRLQAIQKAHGYNSVGIYAGNPTVHNHGAVVMLQGFARALKTRNRFDANSQDANPKLYACMAMYGDQLAITLPDVDRTDYFLMLGANPAASNGSLMTLGDVKGRIRSIRDRGGRVVLIDPRRTETAAWADEHHFIRPGGDAPFVLALLHVLFADGKIDERALAQTTRGLAELRTLADKHAPERVADAVGIPAPEIRRLASEFAAAPRAVAYGRVGTCQNPFGPVASWLIEALNVVTGNFDRAGGAMFSNPAVDVGMLGRSLVGNHYARWHSRVRKLPEFGGQLPAAVMSEEIETPGDGQIRGFVTFAGNPVLSTSNGQRLAGAFEKLEFMVAIDFYLNETSRHAHIILPPTHALEHGHFDVVFHALAVRNTIKFSEQVVAPADDTRHDWEILYELGMRMGGLRMGNKLAERALKLAWKAGFKLSPDRVIDLAIRLGEYGDKLMPGSSGLSLAKVRKAPHGIDLGPLRPGGPKKIRTPDGRIDLAPAALYADAQRIEPWLAERRGDELVLIGRRHVRTNNSWMHNVRSLVKGPDRATLLMHTDDATRLGLAGGSTVKIASRVGEVTAKLETTADIRLGVVSLPHGYGHAVCADSMAIAGALPGPNVNVLTDEEMVEPLLGTAVMNGVPVRVEALA